jgi:hypothetical protein
LQSDDALQRSLVQLLLPLLNAAAVAAQLPADRRPTELSWSLVTHTVHLLSATELTGALREQLALNSYGTVRSSAQRALHSTAQLFAAAPFTVAFVWVGLIRLLGTMCSVFSEAFLQQQGQGSAAVPDAQRQQMVHQVLLVLPQLSAGLRLVAELPALAAGHPHVVHSAAAAQMLVQCGNIMEFIDPCLPTRVGPAAIGRWAYTVNSFAEVTACCAASRALLQALPHMATAAARASQRQLVDGGHKGLAYKVLSFLYQSAAAAYNFNLGSGCPGNAAGRTAAVEALWQLHTTLCRCFHSSAAGIWATADATEQMRMTICMNLCLQSAACISSTVQEGFGDASGGAEGPSRQVGSACVHLACAVLMPDAFQAAV